MIILTYLRSVLFLFLFSNYAIQLINNMTLEINANILLYAQKCY